MNSLSVWCFAAVLQALNLRGCSRVSGACLQHLSALTGVTDLCLLYNPKLAVDDACVASLARLPNLRILGLGNYQVGGKVIASCTRREGGIQTFATCMQSSCISQHWSRCLNHRRSSPCCDDIYLASSMPMS